MARDPSLISADEIFVRGKSALFGNLSNECRPTGEAHECLSDGNERDRVGRQTAGPLHERTR